MHISTNYAIRTIVELEKHGKLQSKQLSDILSIQEGYAMKVLSRLKKAGLIKVKRGSNGGYLLSKDVSAITLLEIISAMEGTIKINRCLEVDGYCSREATKHCKVRATYVTIQERIESELSKLTIEKIIRNKIEKIKL